MIKKYNSVVDENIKSKISEAEWAENLLQYASYKCEIDGFIAAASLFCPELITIKDYVFIKQFWNIDNDEDSLKYIKELEERFDYDKKKIEMNVNTWSLGDFFIGDDSDKMNDVEIIRQFGEVLCYFWKNRLSQVFPEKEFAVILGNELEGEIGLCITMYEV